MTDTVQPGPAGAHTQEGATRRDFLTIAAATIAGIGAACAVWPLIDSMEPSQDVLAAGAPIDVDVSPIQPGQQIIVLWRSRPIFIAHRTPEELKVLQQASDTSLLRDPDWRNYSSPTTRKTGTARSSRTISC